MTSKIITGTITGGYTLSPSYDTLSITSTGLVTGRSGHYGAGLGGSGGNGVAISFSGTVANNGRIIGGSGGKGYDIGGGGGQGAVLFSGGTLSNSGSIAGGKGGKAHNEGGDGGQGVSLMAGGLLVNSGAIAGGAAGIGIQGTGGGGAGVLLFAGGAVANTGSIIGGLGDAGNGFVGSQVGVELRAGGVVVNGAGNANAALILGLVGVDVGYPAAATVTNFGTISGSGGTAVRFDSANDRLVVEAGSTLNGVANGGGGTLELASGAATITGLGTSFSRFGSYIVDAGGSWTLAGTNILAGNTVFSDYGALIDTGTLTNAGSMIGGAGAAGGFYQTHGLAGGSGVTSVQVAGGILANAGAIKGGVGGVGGASNYWGGTGGDGGVALYVSGGGRVVNDSTIAGGVGGRGGSAYYIGLGGAGGVGVHLTNGAVVTNDGLIAGGIGGYGRIGGAGGIGAFLDIGGTLTNDGVISGGGGAAGYILGGSGALGAYLASGGVLTNNGVIDGGAGGYGRFQNGGAGNGVLIAGAGTLVNSGTIFGASYSVEFVGAGGVLVMEAGSLLNGTAKGAGGALELASGTGTITGLGATGTITGAEAVIFSGFGSYHLDAGGAWTLVGNNTLKVGGVLTNDGSLTVGAGVKLSGKGAFTQDGGATLTLQGNEKLTLSGSSSLSGLIDGAGTVAVANATVSGFIIGGSDVLNVFGATIQTGAVTIGDASSAKASVSISKGATWTIEGANGVGRGASILSSLSVAGTLTRSGAAGMSRINVSTGVTGLIDVATGTLDFANKLVGTGVLKIEAGATLEAETTVAATLSAIFNGASATLALMAPSRFGATIAGFAVSDTIDLLKVAATGAVINASDQLVITNGSTTVASLQLTGSYNGATFKIGSDGNGGTEVTLLTASEVTPPPTAATPLPHAFIAALAGLVASPAALSLAAGHAEEARPTLLVARET